MRIYSVLYYKGVTFDTEGCFSRQLRNKQRSVILASRLPAPAAGLCSTGPWREYFAVSVGTVTDYPRGRGQGATITMYMLQITCKLRSTVCRGPGVTKHTVLQLVAVGSGGRRPPLEPLLANLQNTEVNRPSIITEVHRRRTRV